MKEPNWNDVKQLIYEIYDHRIYHAPEINGMINTTYMGMDEHLICFFLSKHQNRQSVERRIIEFLAALRNFVDNFDRAKFYATLCGFIKMEQAPMRRSSIIEIR